jgi:hypothetical protein
MRKSYKPALAILAVVAATLLLAQTLGPSYVSRIWIAPITGRDAKIEFAQDSSEVTAEFGIRADDTTFVITNGDDTLDLVSILQADGDTTFADAVEVESLTVNPDSGDAVIQLSINGTAEGQIRADATNILLTNGDDTLDLLTIVQGTGVATFASGVFATAVTISTTDAIAPLRMESSNASSTYQGLFFGETGGGDTWGQWLLQGAGLEVYAGVDGVGDVTGVTRVYGIGYSTLDMTYENDIDVIGDFSVAGAMEGARVLVTCARAGTYSADSYLNGHGVAMTTDGGYPMARAGSIVDVAWVVDAHNGSTEGDVIFEVRVNGSSVFSDTNTFTAAVGGKSVDNNSQARGTDAVAANDLVSCFVNFNGYVGDLGDTFMSVGIQLDE